MVGNANGQIVESVAIEVANCQGVAEPIAGFSGVENAGDVLMPDLVVGGQACRRSVNHVHGTGIDNGADILVGHADSQIGEAIVVEVAGRQREAEMIAHLRRVVDAGRVLAPKLVVGGFQASRCAVDDVDRAGIDDAADVLHGHANRQVGKAIAVEIHLAGVGRVDRRDESFVLARGVETLANNGLAICGDAKRVQERPAGEVQTVVRFQNRLEIAHSVRCIPDERFATEVVDRIAVALSDDDRAVCGSRPRLTAEEGSGQIAQAHHA